MISTIFPVTTSASIFLSPNQKSDYFFLSRSTLFVILHLIIMEIIYLLSVLITFIVLISISSSAMYKQKSTGESSSLPPGQKGWPVLGEILDYYESCKEHPETFLTDRIRKFSSKIFRTSLFGDNIVLFCGAASNKFLFTRGSEFVTPVYPSFIQKILPNKSGKLAVLSEIRKLNNEFLKPEFLQKKFVGALDLAIKEQFDKYRTAAAQVQPVVVVVNELAKDYLFHVSCSVFLSLDDRKREEKLMHMYNDVLAGLLSLPLDLPGTTFHRGIKSSIALRKEVESIVQEKKNEKPSSEVVVNASTDILSHMLQSGLNQCGEFPSDYFVADMFLAFLVAGIKNSSSVITCTVKNLAELPHVYAQVLQEQMEIAKNKKAGELLNWEDVQKMKYTWCVVQETMRLTPPIPGTFRQVDRDFNYQGFTIPKGWKIYWNVHSTHKDPEYFKSPEEFDPTRFEKSGPPPYTFVAFGGGSHICPGKEYAKIQILVFIHHLVTQFNFEKVHLHEKITYMGGAVVVGGLPIRLHPCNK